MKNFWANNDLFHPPLPSASQISFEGGMTSIYSLNKILSKFDFLKEISPQNVFLKLESENPTRTHKDRSFVYWFSYLRSKNIKEAVISSSGNSAISAAALAVQTSINLTIFISPRITPEKKEKLFQFLNQKNIKINFSPTPKRDAFQYSQKHHCYFLRSSQNEAAVQGYKTIAFELLDQIPDFDAIIIPTSSGTTTKGIYEGLLQKSRTVEKLPRFFIVQTPAVHPLAEEFVKFSASEETTSLASSIVDRIALRKKEILKIIRQTKGSAAIISNKELLEISEFIRPEIKLGWESLMTIAALPHLPAVSQCSKIVCLATS